MKEISQEKIRPSPLQVRAARVLLNNLSQVELAKAAGISVQALSMFENAQTVPHDSTVEKIQEALERRGIVFSNGDMPGVMLDRSRAIIPT